MTPWDDVRASLVAHRLYRIHNKLVQGKVVFDYAECKGCGFITHTMDELTDHRTDKIMEAIDYLC